MARNTLQGKATAGPSSALRSVEKHFHERSAIPQISPLRYAPVEMTQGRVVMARNTLQRKANRSLLCAALCRKTFP
jgi:hypothetical protein